MAVTNVVMLHAIPLIAGLESMLVLILSLMLLAWSVMNGISGFVFRNGIIQTWAIPNYIPSKNAQMQ
jgi:hypothetical protein